MTDKYLDLDVAHSWTFRTSAEGFTAANGNTSFGELGLTFTETAADSNLTSPTLSIDGRRFRRVYVDLTRTAPRNPGSWDGVIYYALSGGGFNEGQKLTPSQGGDPAVGERVLLVFDAELPSTPNNANLPWRTGTVTSIRLDLDNTAGGQFIIHGVTVAGEDNDASTQFKATATSPGRPLVNRARDMVSVADFKTGGTGNDWTQAFLAAVASGEPNIYVPPNLGLTVAGTYRPPYVTSPLVLAQGQSLFGLGAPVNTIIQVDRTIGLISPFIRMGHLSSVSNLTIRFDQSGVTSRTNMIKYAPAIDCTDRIGCRVQNVQIERAWDGVRALNTTTTATTTGVPGNPGQLEMSHVGIGAWNKGVDINGAMDRIHLQDINVWPFGTGVAQDDATNAALSGFWRHEDRLALHLGKCDDIQILGFQTLQGKILIQDRGDGYVTLGANDTAEDDGGPFGFITGLALDADGAVLEMSAGQLTIQGGYKSAVDETAMKFTGTARASVSGYYAGRSGICTNPLFLVEGGASVTFGDMTVGDYGVAPGQSTGPGNTTFKVTGSGGAHMSLVNVAWLTAGINTNVRPLVLQEGGSLVVQGCRVPPIDESWPNTFVEVAGGEVMVSGNLSYGWSIKKPAAANPAIVIGNLSERQSGAEIVSTMKYRTFSFVLDSLGKGEALHGIVASATICAVDVSVSRAADLRAVGKGASFDNTKVYVDDPAEAGATVWVTVAYAY